MTDPSVAIVLEGAPAYLREVREALTARGIASQIVQPPGAKTNT